MYGNATILRPFSLDDCMVNNSLQRAADCVHASEALMDYVSLPGTSRQRGRIMLVLTVDGITALHILPEQDKKATQLFHLHWSGTCSALSFINLQSRCSGVPFVICVSAISQSLKWT